MALLVIPFTQMTHKWLYSTVLSTMMMVMNKLMYNAWYTCGAFSVLYFFRLADEMKWNVRDKMSHDEDEPRLVWVVWLASWGERRELKVFQVMCVPYEVIFWILTDSASWWWWWFFSVDFFGTPHGLAFAARLYKTFFFGLLPQRLADFCLNKKNKLREEFSFSSLNLNENE